MKTTKLSVKFPLIVEYYNDDYIDYLESAFKEVFANKIKSKYLGNVLGDRYMLFYVGKLPPSQDLLELVMYRTPIADEEEAKFFMKHKKLSGN